MTTTNLPTLTIIAGRPGAGKSALAHVLAKRIHCPLISRDAIKEGIVNTTGDKGSPGGTLAHDAVDAFFAVIELLLEKKVTLVADAFFSEDLWRRHIGQLTQLAYANMIICEVDLETAHQRMQQRRSEDPHWDDFHNSPVDQKPMPAARYEAPDLGGPSLIVDCRGGYRPDIEEIYRFTRVEQFPKSRNSQGSIATS